MAKARPACPCPGEVARLRLPWCIGNQLAERALQRSGNSLRIVDGDIAFRSFDRANVGAVEAAKIGQRFLRQSCGESPAPHVGSEYFAPEAEGLLRWHGRCSVP